MSHATGLPSSLLQKECLQLCRWLNFIRRLLGNGTRHPLPDARLQGGRFVTV